MELCVGGGCIGLCSLFNKKFKSVFKKKERKRKKLTWGLKMRLKPPNDCRLGCFWTGGDMVGHVEVIVYL